MRIVFLSFSLVIASFVHSQNLKNTEWVKVKAERIDGSRIVDRMHSDQEPLKFYFTEDSVRVSVNEQYGLIHHYSISNNVISLAEVEDYQIDTLTEAFLIVSQLSKTGEAGDHLSRYTLINVEYLFDYLKQNNEINVIGDSLIECDNQFSPVYNGSLSELIYHTKDGKKINETLTGYFIIAANGKITNVTIQGDRQSSVAELTGVLKSSSGGWVVPPTPKPYLQKLYFTVSYPYNAGVLTIPYLTFHKIKNPFAKPLSFDDGKLADDHYNKGMRLFKNENFEKAAEQFSKCIKIDPAFTDAYYNLAYCYQKTGNNQSACETWNLLKEMGQVEGKRLCEINCK